MHRAYFRLLGAFRQVGFLLVPSLKIVSLVELRHGSASD
jgi:hypothetical protein